MPAPVAHVGGFTVASAISLILGTAAVHAQTAPAGAQGSAGADMLEEVLVTAQRRTQSVQDIPYNISVVSGDQLSQSGLSSASDIAKIVPGLLTVDSGPTARGNTNSFALRGVRTDNPGSLDLPLQTVSTVSTYFGETPVFVPLVLRDIDHIEVLRGPQGTLYGSGAEAGTIRFMPKRPDFKGFSGEVSAAVSDTENASKANTRIDGILNVPLSEQLALRLVAGDERLGGFIDDVGLAERAGPGLLAAPVPSVPGDPTSGFKIAPSLHGANNTDQSYGRAALRYAPTAGYDFELTYLHQKTHADDAQFSNPTWLGGSMDLASDQVPPFPNSSYAVPAGGPYRGTALIRQPYDNKVDLGSLVANIDFGFATFTSATSAYETKTYGANDNTYQWYVPGVFNYLTYYGNYPRTIAVQQDDVRQRSFVQELRLVSSGERRLDYVAGLYYERQDGSTHQTQHMPGINDFFQAVLGVPYADPNDLALALQFNTRFTDRAAFGELTWHVTPAWQATVGGRYFSQSFDVDFQETLPNCGSFCGDNGDPSGTFDVHNSQSVSNHLIKLNTSYDLSRDSKVYVTYAEGFRRGGATGLPSVGIYASRPEFFTYRPDYAKNYEIGIKGTGLGQRLRYSVDLFRIDIADFQFNGFAPSGLPGVFNGKKARSEGAELELEVQVTHALNLGFGFSYTDATVNEATQIQDYPVGGPVPPDQWVTSIDLPAGTRLPSVPKSVFTASADYRMPLAGASGWSLDWHVDGVQRASAPGSIPGLYVSAWTLESVTILNARISLDSGRQWSVDLYGTNLTSDIAYSGAIGLQDVSNTLSYRNVAQPRTIGISARYRFK